MHTANGAQSRHTRRWEAGSVGRVASQKPTNHSIANNHGNLGKAKQFVYLVHLDHQDKERKTKMHLLRCLSMTYEIPPEIGKGMKLCLVTSKVEVLVT